MNVPRRLYSTVPYEQTTAETLRSEGDEDARYLIAPEGGELHDLEAAKLGIAEYLAAHPVEEKSEAPPEEKAVEQGATEDKAVTAPAEVKTEEAPPQQTTRSRTCGGLSSRDTAIMTAAAVQWEAMAGVTHAWIAQCEGYVSLCGREVSGFGGQRSGIHCAQCTASSAWAEKTGEPSYLTPHQPIDMDAMFNMMGKVRGAPRNVWPRRSRTPQARRQPVPFVPLPSPVIIDLPTFPEASVAMPLVPSVEVSGGLRQPESMDAYQALPLSEQRYWAPAMLARQGGAAVWDQEHETAAQFQERCYEQLVREESHDVGHGADASEYLPSDDA